MLVCQIKGSDIPQMSPLMWLVFPVLMISILLVSVATLNEEDDEEFNSVMNFEKISEVKMSW